MELRVGCCGWQSLRPAEVGLPDWRLKYTHRLQVYAARFPVVEVNSTFYRHPRPGTPERWRDLADAVNPAFEFTVKVHREVTHADRFRGERSRRAYALSAAVARALRARVLLLQCPASLEPTEENVEAFRGFLGDVDREGFVLAWEPRGGWAPGEVRKLCTELELVHATDPFAALPVTGGPLAYLRLHGAPPGDRMYRYTYTDGDLVLLGRRVRRLGADTIYVLFNNDTMVADALRFMEWG